MGVPVKVIDRNPTFKSIRPDYLDSVSHKMNLKSHSFTQIQPEINAETSTSENSPTNNSKAMEFTEAQYFAQINTNTYEEPLLIEYIIFFLLEFKLIDNSF